MSQRPYRLGRLRAAESKGEGLVWATRMDVKAGVEQTVLLVM